MARFVQRAASILQLAIVRELARELLRMNETNGLHSTNDIGACPWKLLPSPMP
jgi:hypothetical protein